VPPFGVDSHSKEAGASLGADVSMLAAEVEGD